MGKRFSLFYGWVIVTIAFVSMILIYGIRHSFSVFFPYILDEFHWSRGDISLMLSLNLLVYGLFSPVAGTLAGHWRLRRVMPFGVLIISLATAGCAFSYKLWHFYLLFGFLIPLGSAFTGSPILYPTLMNWFVKRRGLVLGLGQMGGGMSFAYGIFVALVISRFGWRDTYLILAGILITFLLPLILLFFYHRPEEKNLKPYGATESTSTERLSSRGSAIANSSDNKFGGILNTSELWFLVTAHALYWGIGTYLVLAHQIKYTEELGYSNIFSVSVFALFGIALCIGQLSGFLSDWMGREKAGTLATLLSVGGLFTLLLVRDPSQSVLLYIYTVSFGFGVGLFTPTLYASAADIFQKRHFGTVAGLMHTGMGVGGIIGPWLGGYLFDLSGNYNTAFALSIVGISIACLCLWGAAPRKRRQGRRP
jgi:MFS family permease